MPRRTQCGPNMRERVGVTDACKMWELSEIPWQNLEEWNIWILTLFIWINGCMVCQRRSWKCCIMVSDMLQWGETERPHCWQRHKNAMRKSTVCEEFKCVVIQEGRWSTHVWRVLPLDVMQWICWVNEKTIHTFPWQQRTLFQMPRKVTCQINFKPREGSPLQNFGHWIVNHKDCRC